MGRAGSGLPVAATVELGRRQPGVVAVLRVAAVQDTWWEVLPEQVRQLPVQLAQIDAYLDDERFIAPWRELFADRLGRPSVPVETLLRLLYLKYRYQLGYETLCREVTDSLSWRRFCRIPLASPVPHPTTLVKLMRRGGAQTVEQLNAALLGKLVEDKLVLCRKLRIDTTVIEADIDHPTDADLLEHGVRKLWRLVRRIRAAGAARRTRFYDRSRSAGRRLKEISRTLRRRTGQAMGEIDRLTGEIATVARATLYLGAKTPHSAMAPAGPHRCSQRVYVTGRANARKSQRNRVGRLEWSTWSSCQWGERGAPPFGGQRTHRWGRPQDPLSCQGGFVISNDGHDLAKDRGGIRMAVRLTVTVSVRPVRDTTPVSGFPARGQGPRW